MFCCTALSAFRPQRVSLCDSLIATGVPCGLEALLEADVESVAAFSQQFATYDDSCLRRGSRRVWPRDATRDA